MSEGPRLFYGAGFYSLSPVADVRRTTGQLPQGGAYNKEFYKSRKHLLAPQTNQKQYFVFFWGFRGEAKMRECSTVQIPVDGGDGVGFEIGVGL